ncbi:MAG: hypothetical protein J0H91_12955, partial [Rhodospirillales bacterium]|nr:hypothetical protein [Rhodospirillales bacterium]
MPGTEADRPPVAAQPSSATAAPTRAAVILPWEKPERTGGQVDISRASEARLAEAVGLTASIGLVIVHTAILPLRARRPATLMGSGQIEAQGLALKEAGVEVVVIDAQLSPVQQRDLGKAWACKVIDG